MKMIVGLGNPGADYQGHRHNLGFMAVDHFSERHHLGDFQVHKQALTLKTKLSVRIDGGERLKDALLVKPLTYMNLSGVAAYHLQTFYKISLADILVITEDIRLPFGSIKIRPQGSSGGHNGLKSLSQHLGEVFSRLRFGVGYDQRIPQASYVLSDFSPNERKYLPDYLEIISDIVDDFIAGVSLEKLMSAYNRGRPEKNDN